ncbi:RagB/SusD family nutrient uptake outer membrane protein [Paraflavitalea pollutisoli]|uniref:RagB/SusD family nutrient uptake outer membrane protein n=1 Tax=Paraflavitalea pollutisoli TaxID=3034143 RepID=UPI0023EAB08C|nr:RagB/SusD family nutrient uptake outer membrane protein [Paraflavitalea sp. H1-2-19X]
MFPILFSSVLKNKQPQVAGRAVKSLRLLFTICCLALLFNSCKRFLDTKPVDSITPETYYKTREDLDRALSSVYDRLGDRRTYGSALYGFLSFSDEFFIKNQPTGYMSNTLDASMLELNRCWEALYVGIERANMLIERVGGADVPDSVKNEIKGQALFLRGFYYFVLADNWGGVPLKLTYTKSPLEPSLPRAPLAEVYAQIVQDMKEAEGLVKEITAYGFNGRVSKSAVQGVLARVYLTMAGEPLKDESKYAEAQLYAQKVIDSKLHALNPSFSEVFINLSRNRYDIKESIWEVEYFGNNQEIIREGGYVGSWMGVFCPNIDTGFAYDYVHATAKLYSAYEDGDLRRDWTVAPYRFVITGTGTTAPVTRTNWTSTQIYERSAGKYRREYEVTTPKNQDFTCINFPMLRYSDVLLMYAEAEAHVVGATPTGIEYVNQVRRRGFGKPAAVADQTVDLDPGIVTTDYLEAIKLERFRELSYEGLRKHDLLRWGTYVSTMQQQVAAYQTNMPSTLSDAAIKQAARITARSVLFPIPNTEIAVNPYVSQNPGW